ncbi:MAG: hypothetical protein MI919_25180 [Holophagales bacterium]|nr:hypothetical protein [Holophagales bacterium]
MIDTRHVPPDPCRPHSLQGTLEPPSLPAAQSEPMLGRASFRRIAQLSTADAMDRALLRG